MDHFKSHIKQVFERYHPISDVSFEALYSLGEYQQLEKGNLLLDIGKISRHIHILLEGSIVSYYLSADGTVYHKNIFLEGDFVGSTVSALKNEPSNFALSVVENSIVFTFEHAQYQSLLKQHADLKDFYVAYLEKNWVVDKEKREIEIVMKEASERYQDFIVAHPRIEERIPLHYIASHLGITPTQLSRIRKKFREKDPPQHM
ncbi:Crp/Fnr family transcriptional regulator [Flagellimonas algicola]|uniref:Crp/Fnr family transcriptional regulator n=1 Tax=Flagellimonas algicola TaxID=2583815 RepID=A0ABY2WIJ8_9FLAO|nr:Crp/Fnr family transcriptional regulator [Allomuricauda algicola]TMU54467.1 Crp/Fnr family transcriptional regulator [Allomuricauda algicola]